MVQQVEQPDLTLMPAGQVSHDTQSANRLKTQDAPGADRLTTTTPEEPQEVQQQEIVEQEVTVTDANIVPKVEPVSDDQKKKEEEDEDILFCSYMVPGTYAGKRKADIQAVTIANIKEEKINQDYHNYATSQQMEKV